MKFRLLDLVEYELDRLVPKLESARSGTGLRLYKEFAEAGRTIRKNPYFFPMIHSNRKPGSWHRSLNDE